MISFFQAAFQVVGAEAEQVGGLRLPAQNLQRTDDKIIKFFIFLLYYIYTFLSYFKDICQRWAWARGVVDRAPVFHLGDPGSNLGQAKFLQINGFVKIQTILHSMQRCKTYRDTILLIRAWSFISNEKPIVLGIWKNCHAAEKSEVIVHARICWLSWLTGWWTRKEWSEKWRAKV
jgi:hypothetical protein